MNVDIQSNQRKHCQGAMMIRSNTNKQILPATEACELLIKNINSPLSTENQLTASNIDKGNNGLADGVGVDNFSDIFRAVIATEDSEFDFPEIAWSFDENDNEC